jgi:hypothetical protein
MKVGVLLDHNVPLGYFLKGNFTEFFYYLESHPGLGIMTNKPYEDLKKVISRNTDRERYKRAMEEYTRLPLYVDIQKSNFSIMEKHFSEVRDFLFKLINEKRSTLPINIETVSYRYRNLANQLNQQHFSLSSEDRRNLNQKLFWKPPENEDIKIIIEAWKLPSEHKFIASKDRHFIEPIISKAVEDKYGVKCRHPVKLLQELKGYEPF